MKLTAEAGELDQVIAKDFRNGGMDIQARLVDKLGDEEWYFARIRERHGISRDEVLAANRAKLTRRQAYGTRGGSGEQ